MPVPPSSEGTPPPPASSGARPRAEDAVLPSRDASERHRVEAQVRQAAEANAKFRALFDQGAQFAGILSVEGIVMEANRLSLEGCGFTRDDVIGRPFWQCGWWNRSEAAMALVEGACAQAAGGELFQTETRYFHADGTERHVALTIAPVADADGRIIFLSPTGTDITERLAAQDALRESEQRFRLMADSAPVLIWLADADRRGVWFNASWLAFVGRPLEREVGHGWLENVHPDDVDRYVEVYAAACAQRREFSLEYRLRRHDGQFRWLLDNGMPRYGADGGFLGYIGSCVDITTRMQAEEALRRSQATSERQRRLYEAILANTPDLAYVFNLDHQFIYANDGLLRMWGLTWDEAIGRTCLELGYEPWHAAMHDREIDQIAATRATIRGEVPFTGTFGRRIYEYIMVPVLGAGGEVEAVAGTTRDVTERRQAAIDREALLASERAAREEAERASVVREEFLAMLSHELRTPLNAIVGWTHILRSRTPTPQTLEQGLSVIDRNARMQVQLIAELLDMSRIMSGKMEIEFERVDWPGLVDAAIASVRAAADAKDITIERVLRPVPDTVLGDGMRLLQVVANLLSNAIKFTPAGGRVRVALALVDAHVTLSVEDTGQGISPDFLPHVFERFRQADSSAARAHGGLGLGLAIVKQLVELHGGTVQAASAGERLGATFTVRLPMSAREVSSDDSSTPSPGPPPASATIAPPPDLGGLRVLVVDNEPDALELVRHVLEECGAVVIPATSVAEALAVVDREHLDVILSDIGMPCQDGYAFVDLLRRKGHDIPTAALTAFAHQEDRTRALDAGFQLHLTKPIDPRALVATVVTLSGRA